MYILYIFVLRQDYNIYNDYKTVKQPKKRKLIDISEEALNILSIRAVSKGKSLKAYIEYLVEREAKITDEEMYAYLLKHFPPERATPEEQEKFRKWFKL